MPTPLVKNLAASRGLLVSSVEKSWNAAKAAAAKSGHKEDWPYVMNIFLSMMGQKTEMTTTAMAAPYAIPLGTVVREIPPADDDEDLRKRKLGEGIVKLRYAVDFNGKLDRVINDLDALSSLARGYSRSEHDHSTSESWSGIAADIGRYVSNLEEIVDLVKQELSDRFE